MAATIRDIARESGFSISTVSRALANPEHVAEATRVQIQAVASRLGYRLRDRSPQSAHSRVALIVPDLENPFFGAICKGAETHARTVDCTVLVADTDEDVTTESSVAREIAARVDGLVLCAPRMSDQQIRDLAAATPVVLANRHLDGVPSVIFDNPTGMEAALRHLVALGHRRIAYAGGPVASWSNSQRAGAFKAFADARREDSLELLALGNFPPYFQGGVQVADLAVAEGATAVIAYNDIMALGVMDRLAARGISVPEEVSVVGFDNVAVCLFVRPNLTTINLPCRRMGKASIDMLNALLKARGVGTAAAADRQLLPVELRIRQSSSAPPQRKAIAVAAPRDESLQVTRRPA